MIKLIQILSEIKIGGGKPTNDIELLFWLNKNKNIIISELKEDDFYDDRNEEEKEEHIKKFKTILNSKFEMDDLDCPSIGDGYSYYSFSLDKSKLTDSSIELLTIKNLKIYYISYSI